MNRTSLTIALVGGLIAAVVVLSQFSGRVQESVAVTVPALTDVAKVGEVLFETNCAACHGANAAGSDKGPPLVHKIYEPGHHGDAAFMSAVRVGVRPHHWNFGAMPPQPQVKDQDVDRIVAYVRTLQRANGIN